MGDRDFSSSFSWNESWTTNGYGGEGGPGTIVKGSGPEVYFIDGIVRRHIPDRETLSYMGLGDIDRQNYLSDEDLNWIALGSPLPSRRNGALVKGSWAGAYYTYYMENGNRRPIPDAKTFEAMGLDWGAIQYVSERDMNNIPLGQPIPTQNFSTGNLPTSASEAEPFFKTQYWHSKYNSDGPSRSYNCGPASVAMIMSLVGKEPPGISTETSIDHARYLMKPNDWGVTTRHGIKVLDEDGEFTNWNNIRTGIGNLGKRAEDGYSWEDIDRFLSEGKPMVAYGYYDWNWRNQFPDYNATGSGSVYHFNTILGKTSTGKYIVADPMYRGGPVEMTRSQISVFFNNKYGVRVFAAG